MGEKAWNFENLQTFVDLVKAGSVQDLNLKFAEYRDLNKGTIRKRVEAMSKALRLDEAGGLYDFNTGSPTDAGQVLLLDAKDILDAVHKAEVRVDAYKVKREDFLSFGMTNTIGGTFVPRAMRLLMEKRDIHNTFIDIVSDFSSRLIDRFKEHGGVHFLLVPGYVAANLPIHFLNRGEKRKKNAPRTEEDEVHQAKLLTEKIQIFVGEGNPFYNAQSITVSQLQQQKLIIKGLKSSIFNYVEAKVGQPIHVLGNFPLIIGNQRLIFDCVAGNLGVGITGESALVRSPSLHGLDITQDDGTPVKLTRDIVCLYYPQEITKVEKEFLIAFQQANQRYMGKNRDIRDVIREENMCASAAL